MPRLNSSTPAASLGTVLQQRLAVRRRHAQTLADILTAIRAKCARRGERIRCHKAREAKLRYQLADALATIAEYERQWIATPVGSRGDIRARRG